MPDKTEFLPSLIQQAGAVPKQGAGGKREVASVQFEGLGVDCERCVWECLHMIHEGVRKHEEEKRRERMNEAHAAQQAAQHHANQIQVHLMNENVYQGIRDGTIDASRESPLSYGSYDRASPYDRANPYPITDLLSADMSAMSKQYPQHPLHNGASSGYSGGLEHAYSKTVEHSRYVNETTSGGYGEMETGANYTNSAFDLSGASADFNPHGGPWSNQASITSPTKNRQFPPVQEDTTTGAATGGGDKPQQEGGEANTTRKD